MNIKKVVIRVALALFIFCGTMTFIHSNIGVCYASSTTYGDRIDTGLCGNNLTWTVYDSDNNSTGDTLVISGTGAMEDYKKSRDDRDDPWEYSTPWIAKNFPLKKVVLENGLTHIGNCAFIDRSGLTDSLVIPDSVTSIGCSAFENCSGLTGSLVIPDSVTSIGCSAFKNCSGLTGSLVIPNSVTSIGYNAFSGCSGFNGTLTISNKLKTIDSNVFYKCAGLTGSLIIPDSVTNIGNSAFSECSGLTGSLIIPDSVTSIGYNAFYRCTGLEGELILPDKVERIESNTFRECGKLSVSLILPKNLTYIGEYAFAGTGFKTISDFPESLVSILDSAFYGCKTLSGNLVIPSNVQELGYGAFEGCHKLLSITVKNPNCTFVKERDRPAITYNDLPKIVWKGYCKSTLVTYAEGIRGNYEISHQWNTEESICKEATCTEKGIQGIQCSRCNEIKSGSEKDILPTGHTAVTDNAVAPTCTSIGLTEGSHCSICNDILVKQNEIEAIGHLYTEYVSNGDATCLDDGTKTAKCERCDVTNTITDEGSQLGHTAGELQKENTVEETCTEDGRYDEVVYCVVCREEISRVQKTVPAKGHEFGTWEKVSSPNCVDKGSEQRSCQVCGYTENQDLDPTGHTWENEYRVDKEATCTEEGSESIHCTKCDATRDGRVISLVEHTWNSGEITTSATCTLKGVKTYTCSVCGGEKTEQIDTLGHSFKEYYSDGNATCTEDGTKTAHCERCDVTDTVMEEGSKIEHASGTLHKENIIEATCTEQGEYEEAGYCITCGIEVSRITKIVPAKGHDYGSWEKVSSPNCVDKGSEKRTCKNCDYTTYKEIAAYGHKSVVVKGYAATCTKSGKTDGTKCSVCGSVIKAQQTIPPTHKVSKWKTTKKATVLKTGQKKGKCSVCKKTVKQTIAKVPATIKVSSYVSVKYKKSKTIKVKYKKGDGIKSWTSSNKSIATVNKKGKVTGKNRGTAILTVRLKSGKTAKVTVTVK